LKNNVWGGQLPKIVNIMSIKNTASSGKQFIQNMLPCKGTTNKTSVGDGLSSTCWIQLDLW